MTKFERPLDLLNISKGNDVLIYLKDGKILSGKLQAFDININVVLDKSRLIDETEKYFGLMFIRGDSILFISPSEF